METNPFVIKKIPLEQFITILIEIYDRGAEFIDLTGRPNGQEDTIQLSAPQEYMREQNEADTIAEEDLNDLIG